MDQPSAGTRSASQFAKFGMHGRSPFESENRLGAWDTPAPKWNCLTTRLAITRAVSGLSARDPVGRVLRGARSSVGSLGRTEVGVRRLQGDRQRAGRDSLSGFSRPAFRTNHVGSGLTGLTA